MEYIINYKSLIVLCNIYLFKVWSTDVRLKYANIKAFGSCSRAFSTYYPQILWHCGRLRECWFHCYCAEKVRCGQNPRSLYFSCWPEYRASCHARSHQKNCNAKFNKMKISTSRFEQVMCVNLSSPHLNFVELILTSQNRQKSIWSECVMQAEIICHTLDN